jgi:hypothetical protein
MVNKIYEDFSLEQTLDCLKHHKMAKTWKVAINNI